MNSTPFISIIIPCYQQGEFLEHTLQSIFYQHYTNWECLIINDGSTDNTEDIAVNWMSKDARFKYLYQENSGLSSARNRGLINATGDFIQFLDGDDWLKKDKIELSVNEINFNKVQIVICNFELFDNHLQVVRPPYCTLSFELFNLQDILYRWDEDFSIPIHTALISKDLFSNIAFKENLFSKEDWVMWVELFKNNPKVSFINKPLVVYRIHNKSMTMSKDLFPDHILALDYIKSLIDSDTFEKLLVKLIERYYRKTISLKVELKSIKQSPLYKINVFLKKVLNKVNR